MSVCVSSCVGCPPDLVVARRCLVSTCKIASVSMVYKRKYYGYRNYREREKNMKLWNFMNHGKYVFWLRIVIRLPSTYTHARARTQAHHFFRIQQKQSYIGIYFSYIHISSDCRIISFAAHVLHCHHNFSTLPITRAHQLMPKYQ